MQKSLQIHISFSGADELALQIVNVALTVKEVLYIVALNLDTFESSARKILRVINIYHVIILTGTLRLILHLRVAVLLPSLIIAVFLSRGGFVVVQVMRFVNVIDQDASLLV